MRFKRSVQGYGRTPEPETPFQRAGQLWDDRIGSARVQAHAWRVMAFASLGLTCGIAGGFVWLAAQSRVVPYVVAVDRLGEARAVSKAELAYEPTDPQIAWALSKFIAHVRGVSLDPVVMRADWLEAYDFATERGGRAISEYARASGALTRIGERTVSVQVTSVVRASDNSFQVKWTEGAFDRGNAAGTSQWTAILTLARKPPRDAETLRRNPLGIYVDAIDWSRELEPDGQGDVRSQAPADPNDERADQGGSPPAAGPAPIASPEPLEVLP
ncbi:type IV secretion system protein VirB5 [Novosphingobium sp. PhB55]|uniref:conjugal transfer protein TrbF n=1 Tax=Novosphingobium sp. PhB55 TaxID=2485106 RepID=UPI00106672B2|nr:conjugal transfer protein TrbF [Novosphingobium sp. PhB55]TDW59982.1 type IV secretion system protein VirB5 [Novosphingobium sp. PhB55]